MNYWPILWVYFLGCLSGIGYYAWWLERGKPATDAAPSPMIDEDEALLRLERVLEARAALARDEFPNTVH